MRPARAERAASTRRFMPRSPFTGSVFASTIFSVGATLPVRPSSNFTCGLDVLLGLAAVQRVDQHLVLLGDEAAPDLARAGQFVVVGVEFLVQHQEAAICVPASFSSAARSALTLAMHSRDQLQHLGLLARSA